MKRMSMILMACLMVLGMSQCKKENQNASTEPEGVKITLTVDNGGERVAVTPGETVTTVTFEDGDVILVADDQHYLGSLSRTNGAFTGTVTQPGTDHLHFFFAGNKVAPSSLTPGTSTGCTVDMSDQSDGPAVVSYASMAYDGSSSVTASVKLLNKASGLVKFTTNIGTTNDITIAGVYNKMNITFGAEPTIATDQTERGTIKLNRYTGDNENKTFLAVIPEQSGVNGASVTVTGFTADNIDIPPVTESMNGAMSITLTAAPSVPAGAINGKFSVSATKQVYFSKGNLQYIGSATTPYWKFADNQWKYLGTTTGQNSQYQTVDRDLFGWGTSGYNHGAMCYQPWSTYPIDGQYNPYNSTITNLYDGNGQADWGYNAISNGGNTVNSGWRTLTQPEWDYVINTRTTTSDIRYAKATVNNVNGVILLPDNWTTSTYTLSNTNTSTAGYDSNDISAEDWTNTLEANGAVFLPAAGNRTGPAVGTGSNGYWSASYYNNSIAYILFFDSDNLYTSNTNTPITHRRYGLSVRLVRPAE